MLFKTVSTNVWSHKQKWVFAATAVWTKLISQKWKKGGTTKTMAIRNVAVVVARGADL